MHLRHSPARPVRALARSSALALLVAAVLLGFAPAALAATVPAAPVDVVARPGDGSFTLTWGAPADGGSPITGYSVCYADQGCPLQVGPDARTATLDGFANGPGYLRPRVHAVNAVGLSAPGLPADETLTVGAPLAVTDLRAAPQPSGAIRVSWTVPGSNGAPLLDYAYRVDGRSEYEFSDVRNVTGSPQTAWADIEGLDRGTAHRVVVQARNSRGAGPTAAISFDFDRRSEISRGSSVHVHDGLVSPNGRYTLDVQPDGNLVTYAGDRPLWNTATYQFPGVRLDFQTDGNLVLRGVRPGYDPGTRVTWNSDTWSTSAQVLRLQDDGNLVLYDGRGAAMWSSGWDRGQRAVTDTLWSTQHLTTYQTIASPNGTHRLVMQDDGNAVVYASSGNARWSTRTWGRSGIRLVLQPDGNLVAYDETRRALWSSGTWGAGTARLTMQDDGNLVLYTPGGRALWSSTYGRTY